jgi:uncharacterized phage protein (TIGR01671 family)
MRTLKFRVYIPEFGRFTHFQLGYFDYSDRYLDQYDNPVQQSTGLKDSRDTDIYEGDLLEFAYKDDGVKFVGEVQYSEKFACFVVVIANAFETFSDLADYAASFKVVGNTTESKKSKYGQT